VYYKHNLYTTLLNTIEIPQVATCILQIHETKQKTSPVHTIINIYRRPKHMPDFNKDLQNAIDSILSTSPRTDITIQGDIHQPIQHTTKPTTHPKQSTLPQEIATTLRSSTPH
jgi:hypothetical protein